MLSAVGGSHEAPESLVPTQTTMADGIQGGAQADKSRV